MKPSSHALKSEACMPLPNTTICGIKQDKRCRILWCSTWNCVGLDPVEEPAAINVPSVGAMRRARTVPTWTEPGAIRPGEQAKRFILILLTKRDRLVD